jgi:O-acetyl-ADP-ribose deacetylase (regulator of RNase III)
MDGLMSMVPLHERMHLRVCDITLLWVDAIVNPANISLLGGGGLDGAIHTVAGPELLEECRTLGGCPTGEARLTKGYRLRSDYVIHAVGPVWHGGIDGEPELLASAYRNSLQLAEKNGLERIAFPCISTGAFRYPKQDAAAIAFQTVRDWLEQHDLPRDVTFCCLTLYDASFYEAFSGWDAAG